MRIIIGVLMGLVFIYIRGGEEGERGGGERVYIGCKNGIGLFIYIYKRGAKKGEKGGGEDLYWV